MKLQNVTAVLLVKNAQGKLSLGRVIENPEVPAKDGKPVVGPYLRRLLTVKEVARLTGLSLNKASELRRSNPLACLADFPGQEPMAEALRQASSLAA